MSLRASAWKKKQLSPCFAFKKSASTAARQQQQIQPPTRLRGKGIFLDPRRVKTLSALMPLGWLSIIYYKYWYSTEVLDTISWGKALKGNFNRCYYSYEFQIEDALKMLLQPFDLLLFYYSSCCFRFSIRSPAPSACFFIWMNISPFDRLQDNSGEKRTGCVIHALPTVITCNERLWRNKWERSTCCRRPSILDGSIDGF